MKTVKVKNKLISESYVIDAKITENRFFTFRDYMLHTKKVKINSFLVGGLIVQIHEILKK